MASTEFDRDTAIRKVGDGVYEASISKRWWVVRGPNGGYLAAILVRALTDAVDDPLRFPRSFTVHYASAPVEGSVRISVRIERTGRSMTSCSCRMEQEGKLVALALAAFSASRDAPELSDVAMPAVPSPGSLPAAEPLPGMPEIGRRFDQRWAIGERPGLDARRAEKADTGGWLRLAEPRLADATVLAAYADAWIPAIFTRFDQPVVVPTVDLTIHFRVPLPYAALGEDDFALVRFVTKLAADGFLEEDGEIWAPDGTLLAQSRQLATILSLR
jgi:acyl-CoA thioesterase